MTFGERYSIALRVADCATMDRLRAQGVEFEYPQVYDSSVCHMAFFGRPAALILHHRYARTRTGPP